MTTEPSAIDARTATTLIAAAATSAPAGAPMLEVLARAEALMRAVPALVARSEVLASCRAVTGVIVKVEEAKGRGLITFHATMGTPADTQEVVDGRGVEYARTPWLNEPAGRALFDQARSLIGRNVRYGKWTEQLSRTKAVSMIEWIEDLGPDPAANGNGNGNGNGPARAAQPERATAPAPQPQRSHGSVTRPTREAVAAAALAGPAALPSRDDVQARAREAEQAEAERRAPAAPVDWFVSSGWRDQTACETARAALVARVEAAPPGAGLSFNAWVTARGWRWEDHWTAEETALASARLDEMTRAAAPALVGGGAPAYKPDQEPF